jgi:hypothetical protein
LFKECRLELAAPLRAASKVFLIVIYDSFLKNTHAANHGFLIRDTLDGNPGAEQQLHSREKGENPPYLVITFGPAQ